MRRFCGPVLLRVLHAHLRFKGTPRRIAPVAKILLTTIQADNVDGQLALEDLAEMLGQMFGYFDKSNFIRVLREGGLRNRFWINEVELPPSVPISVRQLTG
jgi:hypothetical protein